MAKTVVLVTGDLMAGSQAEGAARAAGVTLRTVGAAKVAEAVESAQPALVVFDLSSPTNLADAVAAIRAASPQTVIAAYGPHVQEKRLEAAQAAGCDLVMTRGQFHRQAAEVFARYAASGEGELPST
ncbi:MAG: hypothetical protein AAGJ46_09895 [Planctomycetota bacterium]